MRALITGASSGIGKEFALQLNKRNYDLILVGRNKEKLTCIKKELCVNCKILNLDLSQKKDLLKIEKVINSEDIDLLVNCAGIGSYGYFKDIDIKEDLNLISLNIIALDYISKIYIKKCIKNNKGYLLNISSTAAFQPGPLMSTYYASKSYVYSLTCAIYEELKDYDIGISVLMPGPVKTNFNKNMGINYSVKPMETEEVVKYTLKQMKKSKLIIIPGITNRISTFFVKFIPIKILLKITKKIQVGKMNDKKKK